MFSQCVSTPFDTDIADELFPRIVGNAFDNDRSFVGTARAILYPRLPSGSTDTITINYVCDEETFAEETFKERWGADLPLVDPNVLAIVDFRYPDESNKRFDTLPSLMAARADFARDEKAEAFFGQVMSGFKVLIYVNDTIRSTVIFTEQLNRRKYHALQGMLPRYFRWFFAEAPATPEEKKILASLLSNYANKVKRSNDEGDDPGYIDLMESLSQNYDFRGARIAKYLPAFVKRAAEGERDRVKQQIAEVDRDINNYEDQIANYLRQRYDLETRLFGLEVRGDNAGDDGLADWFRSNRQVQLVSTQDATITFCVYTTLDWWDEEYAKSLVANHNGGMYDRTGGIRKADWEILMKAIFLDHTMKIRTCAAYRMDINEGVRGLSGYSSFEHQDTYIPNAHIQRHGCTGNYRSKFRDAVRHGDYVLAMEIAMTSAKSLNFADISFGEMIHDMADAKEKKYIQDEDGNLYTPADAIKRLKALAKTAKKEAKS